MLLCASLELGNLNPVLAFATLLAAFFLTMARSYRSRSLGRVKPSQELLMVLVFLAQP